MLRAEKKKRDTYPEFGESGSRAKLIVFGVEVGGRWSKEASKFLSALARAKSQDEPSHLRHAAFSMWHRRWSGIIAIAAQRALAASLLLLPEVHGAGGAIPSLNDVLAEGRYEVETEDTLVCAIAAEDGIQIQSTGYGMIAPPGEARGAMDSGPGDRGYFSC